MLKPFLILCAALLAAPLEAHNVKVDDADQNGIAPPGPMVLYFASIQKQRTTGSIRITPQSNEDCTVMVTGGITTNTTLIKGTIKPVDEFGSGGNPALTVTIFVEAIREPVNGSGSDPSCPTGECATVDAEWHATGMTQGGAADPVNCDATNPHPFKVIVNVVALPTAAQKPNGASSGDPISTLTGEVTESGTDLSLGGPLPLAFSRYYASMLNPSIASSALGPNWMHNFNQSLLISGNTAAVSLYGGKVVRFQQSGAAWQLASTETVNYQLAASGSNYQFLDLPNDLIYTFSSTGALTRIEDRSGNALTITQGPSGPVSVSDGLGRTLTFAYSGATLASVTDQTGRRVLFTYTGANLTAVTDPDARITNYTYTTSGSTTILMVSKTKPAGNKPVTHAFDGLGRANREIDSLGNATTVAYATPSAGATTVADPLNALTRHTYQESGNLTLSTDAATQNTLFTYDSSNRVTSVTDRLGAKTTISYHVPSGFVSSITGTQGNSTAFTYTAQAQGAFTFYNRTKATFADGTSTTFTFDAQGHATSVSDPAGKVWTYTYNPRGQFLTTTNPAGGVATYTYNADGTVASIKNPAGDVTTYAYDAKKRLMTVQNADKTSLSFTWDDADQLLSMTDERGKTTKLTYDSNGSLKSVTDPLNRMSNFTFDTDDQPISSTDPLGKITTLAYDALGNVIAMTNAAGEKTNYRYDALSRLVSVADPAGKGLSFSYDAEGQITGIADALGNKAVITRDKLGRITRLSTPLGENFDLTYDAGDRITSTSNALGATTAYGFDNRDLPTSVKLPGNISAAYTWAELPILTSVTDPNGNVWTRAYDNLGRMVSRTDPLGQSVSYAYDGLNRVTTLTTPQGSLQIAYDAAGNQTQRQYSDGTVISLSYDDDNRPLGGAGVTLRYDAAGRIVNSNGLLIARDDVGRIAAITYAPGKTVTYKYDVRGLLAQIADWTGAVTAFSYDDAQRLASMTRPNGVVTRYTYDKNGRMSAINEISGDQSLASISLQRDATGNVTSADRSMPQAPVVAPGVLPLAYDAADQVSGASYDGMGRITNDGLRSYTWNLASELTAYSGPDGSASFGYDEFGLRTSVTAADGTTQNYVLNYALGLPSIATVQAGGADQRYYVFLPGGALLYAVEAADNSHHYYHFDEIGSTTFLTDDAAKVTDQYGVTPYGETVTATGTTVNPFTWLGQWGVMQEGSTGLYYMRVRYYDSATARFLSRDPVHQLDPRAINPYQYVAENPMSNVDPMGLKGGSASAGGFPWSKLPGLLKGVSNVAAFFLQRRADAATALFERLYSEMSNTLLDWYEGYLNGTIHSEGEAGELVQELASTEEEAAQWVNFRFALTPGNPLAHSRDFAGFFRPIAAIQRSRFWYQEILQKILAAEGMADRLSRAAAFFRTASQVLAVLGVTIQAGFVAAEDYRNGAGLILTGTDVLSTAGGTVGVLAGGPVTAVGDLALGGKFSGAVSNGLKTPNTIGVLLTSRVNSRQQDAIGAMFRRGLPGFTRVGETWADRGFVRTIKDLFQVR